jgi:hypothetical protein
MFDYVDEYGGYVELWVRSPKHPEGATKLTQPLRDRLADLRLRGKAEVKTFP